MSYTNCPYPSFHRHIELYCASPNQAKKLGKVLSSNPQSREIEQKIISFEVTNQKKFKEVSNSSEFKNLVSIMENAFNELAKSFEDSYGDQQILPETAFFKFIEEKHPQILIPILQKIVNLFDYGHRNGNPEEISSSEFRSKAFEDFFPKTGYLYKIKDKDGKTCGYLCGTMHVFDASFFPLNESINRAIQKSGHLFLEIKNLDKYRIQEEAKFDEFWTQQPEAVLQKSIDTFDSFLTKNAFLNWNEIKEKNDFYHLTRIQAIKLCKSLYELVMAKRTGSIDAQGSVISGLDHLFYSEFKRLEKPIFGLAPLKDHIKFCQPILGDVLKNMVPPEDLDKWYEGHLRLCTSWLKGTAHLLEMYPSKEIGEDRSEKFGEVIDEDLKSNKSRGFYAFGLLHLFDEKNVISYLEEKGYRIFRI